MFPNIAHAAPPATLDDFLSRVSYFILNPIIGLLFALAFMYFLWGVFVFIKNSDNETDKETGRQHMIWGLVGMVIMVGSYAIISIITGTFGVDNPFPGTY